MTAQIPHAQEGRNCPFNGKDMAKVCHKCPLWVHVRGQDPQGGEVDLWNCSFAWLPTLLIENSQQQRMTGAAVETLRNEVVRVNTGNLLSADAAAALPKPKG